MLATVVETTQFIKQAEGLLSEQDIDKLKYHLAANPHAGDLIQGTGGVRKLRWAAKGKGKSGGARIIHYFRATAGCVYIITAFDKSAKIDLTPAERNALKLMAKSI